MDPTTREIVVTPSEAGNASFTCTVSVEMPPVPNLVVMVQLDSTTDSGFSSEVSPQSIPFTQSGDLEVTVTVTVPEGSSAKNITTVTLDGMATYPGGSTSASSTATITVTQYYRLQPTSDDSGLVKTDGEMVYFSLTLYNRGNGDDSFRLDFANLKELDAKDVSVSIDKNSTGIIPPDRSETIKLVVKYKGTNRPLQIYVQMNIRSMAADKAGLVVQKTYMVGVYFEPNPSFEKFIENPLVGTTRENYILLGAIIAITVGAIVGIVIHIKRRKRRRLEHKSKARRPIEK